MQVAAMQAQRLSVAFSNLGGILKMQGRLQDAIACYEHVALLQPQVPEVQVLFPLCWCPSAHVRNVLHTSRLALDSVLSP